MDPRVSDRWKGRCEIECGQDGHQSQSGDIHPTPGGFATFLLQGLYPAGGVEVQRVLDKLASRYKAPLSFCSGRFEGWSNARIENSSNSLVVRILEAQGSCFQSSSDNFNFVAFFLALRTEDVDGRIEVKWHR